jgi:hypothetical protein
MDTTWQIAGRPLYPSDYINHSGLRKTKEWYEQSAVLSDKMSPHLIIYGDSGTLKKGTNTYILEHCIAPVFTHYTDWSLDINGKDIVLPLFYSDKHIEFSARDIQQRFRHVIIPLVQQYGHEDPFYIVIHDAERIRPMVYLEFIMRYFHFCRFIFISQELNCFTPEILAKCSIANHNNLDANVYKQVFKTVVERATDGINVNIEGANNVLSEGAGAAIMKAEERWFNRRPVRRIDPGKQLLKIVHDGLQRTVKGMSVDMSTLRRLNDCLMNILARDVNQRSLLLRCLKEYNDIRNSASNKEQHFNEDTNALINTAVQSAINMEWGSRPIIHLQEFVIQLLCQ